MSRIIRYVLRLAILFLVAGFFLPPAYGQT